MKINSIKIPEDFVIDLKNKRLRRDQGSWELKENLDYYRKYLETELGAIYETEEDLHYNTKKLLQCYQADGSYGEENLDLSGPSAISDILNFEKIINFAISGDGSPFCFDFRSNTDSPSVIWWDDTYWRILAPSYKDFIGLFNLSIS